MKNARYVALKALLMFQTDNMYSEDALDKALKDAELDARDSAFAANIFYGVIERRITLDYILGKFSKSPLNKLKKQVLAVLRMSLYQILYLDRVPNSAAINEGLKLLDMEKRSFAKGFCNGVLRSIDRSMPIDLQFSEISDEIERLSVSFSIPCDILKIWRDHYPADWKEIAESFSRPERHTVIRVNTLKTTAERLIEQLRSEEGIAEYTALENALKLTYSGSITKLKCFKQGFFHVQDISSQLAANALSAKPGERVLDMCAAPGGKSFTIAECMDNDGELVSCDIYPKKIDLIDAMADQLGIDIINTVCIDSSKKAGFSDFDRVLCDVPCSGLGVIAKKPEIRYKKSDELDNLVGIQYLILCNGAEYLKKGGVLVYSTCTLNRKENDYQIKRFLSEHDDFEIYDSEDCIIPNGIKTFMPHKDNCDGFFVAVMRKKR